jgi:hypothetical protein
MKAFLWALYLPTYENLVVEVPVGDRYKPDVVALDPYGRPLFWGEAGHVSPDKTRSLVRRYPQTHFAFAKWDTPLDPFVVVVQNALNAYEPGAPFDLLRFPADSAERFIEHGEIEISHADLDWIRLTSSRDRTPYRPAPSSA